MKRRVYDLNAKGSYLQLGLATKIMGIVNCTPDSFSRDGILNKGLLLKHALKLIKDGADIIDVGGESTRPGAKPVSESQELQRVIPFIKALSLRSKVLISIDTTKPEVAKLALDAGASIVNVVNGTKPKAALLKVVKDSGAGIILMHSRGNPRNMARLAQYKDVTQEVARELLLSVQKCLEIGIKKDRIVLDPGIGFAKGLKDNLRLINELPFIAKKGFPILLGPSRKSFIGAVLENNVNERLIGTAAAVSAGILRGAHIVRVHDVKEMKQIALMTDAILNMGT